jgi:hypothetical protein
MAFFFKRLDEKDLLIGSNSAKYGIIAALTRMSDKWNRLEHLLLQREKNRGDFGLVDDEPVTDTLLDMATYCLMTIVELKNM